MPTLLLVPDPSAGWPARSGFPLATVPLRTRAAALSHAAAWQKGYAALQRFRASRGHCRVPVRYVGPDGYCLGHWVDWQRQRERHGWLRPEQRRALDQLGFVWRPRGYSRAAAITAAVAAAAADPTGWTGTFDRATARSIRAARRRGRLSPGQRATLDAIGFAWSASDARFAHGVAMLRAYRRAGGTFPVSQGVVWDEFRLGEWVHRQREKAETGRLGDARWDAIGSVVLEERAAAHKGAGGARP